MLYNTAFLKQIKFSLFSTILFCFNKLNLIKISTSPTKVVNLKLSLEEVLQVVYSKLLIVLFALPAIKILF